jgi:hypothetical protein
MTQDEKFKNITTGIHNIAIALAILVGGIWTLFTFSSLGERQKAQNELFKQAVIDITIECNQQHFEQEKDDYIQADVKIVNQGKRNTNLNFSNSALEVSKLVFLKDGSTDKVPQIEQRLEAASIVLRSGATQHYSFVVKIEEKGFYMLKFSVPLDSVEMAEHIAAGGPKGEITWGGSTSILIK